MLETQKRIALSSAGTVHLRWSPPGSALASFGPSDPIRLWDAAAGSLLQTLPQSEGARHACFSLDGSRLAATGEDGSVAMWECASGTSVPLLSEHTFRSAAVWSPDGSRLAAALPGNSLGIWESYRGGPAQRFETHSPVTTIAWSEDGAYVAAIGGADPIQVFNLRLGRLYRQVDMPRVKTALCWGPGSNEVTVGYENGDVEIWDLGNLRQRASVRLKLRGHHARILALACSGDRRWVATKSADRHLGFWDAQTGEKSLQREAGDGLAAHPRQPIFASMDSSSGELRIWGQATEKAAPAELGSCASRAEPPTPAAQRASVFISYCHDDYEMCARLRKHLSSLAREGVHFFDDSKIAPGTDWMAEILKHLESAHLILLLVSADFLASDFCTRIETQRALERRGEAHVIPIVLRDCDFQATRLGAIQAVPQKNGRLAPISSYADKEDAYALVARVVRQRLEQAGLIGKA